ncbi:type VI secretion system Vgr family protein [Aquimarina longa]|uniref:type VI secretion system Vgr family protein n=1 Tax=Aquimarina longa TaxID=1080221 RepID=UPI000783C453|nr:contractile injection system protein, VgrG/Pvc8 family [Aquimarina longa]
MIQEIKVYIAGKPLLGYTSFSGSIAQEIGKHHTFSIVFSSFLDKDLKPIPFQDHDKYQNQEISIFSADGALQFTGIILSVQHTKNDNGNHGGMLFRGASPTIGLQKSTQCQSFDTGTTIKNMSTHILRDYPTLSTYYGSETNKQLGYTVQYNESDWDFITRISKRYGIFTYYDGEQLNIGRNPTTVIEWSGTFGQDVNEFIINDNLEEQLATLHYHDHITQQPHTATSTHNNSTTPNILAPTANRSAAAFSKQSTYYYTHLQNDYFAQQHLDYLTKVHTESQKARMITAIGSTTILGLKPCDQLQVTGHHYSNSATSEHPYGTYELTKVTHHFNNTGYYHNKIEAIVTGVAHPPYSDINAIPKIEAMSAIVVDNRDPEGLNRVKLQFPWQQQANTTTDWVRCTNAHAGAAHGSYMVAEIGDEVFCNFLGDNPEHPLVMGSAYNKTTNHQFYTPDNTIKAVKTKSGNTIISNDADGSITVQNQSGSTITLEPNGNIKISAPETLTLEAKNMLFKTTENMRLESAQDTSITTQGKIQASSTDTMTLQAQNDIRIDSTTNATLHAQADTTIEGKNVITEALSNADMIGQTTTVSGRTTEIKGASNKIDIT